MMAGRPTKTVWLTLVICATLTFQVFSRERLEIVVTIAPIHSLVAGITRGIAQPKLLMPGGSSPHAYALKPSDAKALARAHFIIRVGETLETVLKRPIEALGQHARIVTLDEIDAMTLLPMRRGGVWEGHAYDGADVRHSARHSHAGEPGIEHGGHNPHIWLDPHNAKIAVGRITKILAEADPTNADALRANAQELFARLNALDRELESAIAPIRAESYVVFHDAFPYFENRYGLSPAGAFTVSPDRRPGARRLSQIRRKIVQLGATCVFSEPQFEPKLAAALIEGTNARNGVLDPLGATLTPGPDLYFILMRSIASGLTACLAHS